MIQLKSREDAVWLGSRSLCGIIGFTGNGDALGIVLRGLKRLEYRGYDSAGVALLAGERIWVAKRAGSVDELIRTVGELNAPRTGVGIGHTRWATHGGVSDRNAHPHLSCHGEVAVVHNGIIENYEALRSELESRGHTFTSDTDTEVIAHLLEEELSKHGSDPKEALTRVVTTLKGSFAFIAIGSALGSRILAARHGPPLVVGYRRDACIPSSDVLSFLELTDDAIFLENESCVVIGPGNVEAWLVSGERLELKPVKVAIEVADIEKRGYVHHTLKEIHDQRATLLRSLTAELGPIDEIAKAIRSAKKVFLVAAGTSYHACLIAKYVFAEIAGIDTTPVLASEYSLHSRWVDNSSVVLAVSQSGETADVLDAVRDAKSRGASIIGIVNMPGSSLERFSDLHLNVSAGPEIGVAATKSFTSQVATLLRVALRLSGSPIPFDPQRVAEAVEEVLELEQSIAEIARELRDFKDLYVIGRGIHYPLALEGALKVKELAYVHAEGLAAGELKHGTLALIEKGTPVVVLNPHDETYHDTLSNCMEVKARGARVIGISDEHHRSYDYFIRLPRMGSKYATVLLEALPLQLLAYYLALERGAEIDRPKNLAKSVTVK
ncbi:MAG: glutamine--fructose-6-phosphate transaminase (isomerizing) [Thaumarchaeota archaeon]|nr:glutamine--fructose-6-phosphate transaminase (isomerizing) [Candidatus Calditenuaceae archaeon]MDW8186537.1 glutamine--fructose-6-phosphate transaminase (isomerizing) [Nitrososphaerota archaeon]